MDGNKTYTVKNRSASYLVVRIPELSLRREFAPGESLKMSFDELQKLSFQPGGRELMSNFLQIMEDEVNNELNIPREAEYYMNEQQIVDLLRSGSIEQFEDCLDFAPIGVIDLVKDIAIKMPLTDTVKIQALKDKTGFDVIRALENAKEDAPEPVETTPKAELKAATSSGRRTTPNYKVTKRAE